MGAVLRRLRQDGPGAVIGGSEPGIPLADRIAAALRLPGNDPATSVLRRNKHVMTRALDAAGIASTRQVLVSDARTAVAAAESLGGLPVVVKPVDSGGGDGVQLCASSGDVERAFAAIHGTVNVLGSRNTTVLVQEYLRGHQFMVNAVSIGGRHRITEIWREDRIARPGVGIVYDKEVLLPYSGEVQRGLISYTTRALDALGVREGPSHTELCLTPRGPVLIETAARLQGGIESRAIVEAIGECHMTTTLHRYADPEGFRARLGEAYAISRTPMVVNLIARRAGVVRKDDTERLLPTLPSFFSVSHTPRVGDRVERTSNLLTKTGHIYLLHEDVGQLFRDYDQIRAWERTDSLIAVDAPGRDPTRKARE
jgi:L-amino acid ligase